MSDLLDHPVVQAALVPLLAALVVAFALRPIRLSGLALIAGFAATVQLVSGIAFSPLTATRKLVLAGLVAAALGVLLDLAVRRSRASLAPGVVAAAVAVWVFWSVLAQKDAAQLALWACGVALFVGFVTAAMSALADSAVRAGAAGVGLGIGVAISAVVSASALYLSYGASIAAASGGFLLLPVLTNRNQPAGATFTLTAGLLSGLCGAAALLLAQLPWYCLPVLALIPLAARLPIPIRAPVIAQAAAACVYTVAVGAAASYLAWRAATG